MNSEQSNLPSEDPLVNGDAFGVFRAHLKAMRTAAGLTFEAMDTALGFADGTSACLVAGSIRPSVSQLCRISDGFQVNINSLLGMRTFFVMDPPSAEWAFPPVERVVGVDPPGDGR